MEEFVISQLPVYVKSVLRALHMEQDSYRICRHAG